MFNRTISELEKCKTDAMLFAYLATLITQSFFILYYVCALCLSFGHPIVYAALLSLTAGAFIFFLSTESPTEENKTKVHKYVRIFVRYAKYCVHIVAITLTLYTLYVTDPTEITALSPILLVFAVLALLIQLLGELVGFLARRYFKNLLDAAVEETEFLRSVISKVESGAEAFKAAKEKITAIPHRTADAASGLRDKIAGIFKKKEPSIADFEYEDKT